MTGSTQRRPAVFLDRDGTLIEDVDYLSSADQIRVFSFSARALKILKDQGFLLVVISNQSGVGRGLLDIPTLESINVAVVDILGRAIDAVYYCPHLPEDNCTCRKPLIGMVKKAVDELNIDIANSWIVGDKKSDIETGFNGGMSTALVLTGYGEQDLKRLTRMPDIVADNLWAAAQEICSRTEMS